MGAGEWLGHLRPPPGPLAGLGSLARPRTLGEPLAGADGFGPLAGPLGLWLGLRLALRLALWPALRLAL